MSIKYFVSGDIHSFFENWMQYLEQAGFELDNPNHKIIICGDLFDRGDETLECFEFVKRLAAQDRLVYVRGNHEDLLFDCVNEIRRRFDISRHHISNGTLKTVAQIADTNQYDVLCNCYDQNKFDTKVAEVLNFISENTVDYFELGDYIFVHGWVPCDSSDPSKYHARKNVTLAEKDTWNDKWDNARWLNGMECWNQKAIPEGKTVVCGHWHTSWGHFRFHGHDEEFPSLSKKDARLSFKPFVEDGIIALDGCTAYTGLVNVAVFTVDEENNVTFGGI